MNFVSNICHIWGLDVSQEQNFSVSEKLFQASSFDMYDFWMVTSELKFKIINSVAGVNLVLAIEYQTLPL